MKDKCKIIWQKIKRWLCAKLAGLDRKRVATLLATCGIIAVIVLAIIICNKAAQQGWGQVHRAEDQGWS